MAARLGEIAGAGQLNSGIAAARRAQQLWPEQPRARFWEGRLQELAGRPAKARACYQLFVEASPSRSGSSALQRHAEKFLAKA